MSAPRFAGTTFLVLLALLPGAPARAQAARTTVGVDLGALSAPVHRKLDGLALEKRVVLRLVQEGFAVVAPAAGPDALVRVREAGPRAVTIEVSVRGVVRRRRVSWEREALGEVHLEIAQKAVELVRTCLRLAPPPPPLVKKAAPPPPPKPKPPPPKPKPKPVPPRPKPRRVVPPRKARRPRSTPTPPGRFELKGGLAALYRGVAFDPLLWGELRFRLRGGFAFRVVSGFTPASGGGVTVNELQAQLGAGYRFRLARGLDLEVGLLVGVLAHFWSLDSASGSAVDALVSLPVSFSWWPLSWLGLELRLSPGIADSSRTHMSAGQVLWRREAGRISGGLGLVFRIP